MRLALTHAYSWPEVRRGAERIVVELGRALAGRGHDVVVLTSGREAGTTEADGVTTVRLRRRLARPRGHELDFGLRLRRHLAGGRFDAVHSFGVQDALAAVRTQTRSGHRTVYTNLGLPERWWWDRQPERRAHERVVGGVDVYGCMSRYALEGLRREYGREGVLTPGGVDLSAFAPAPQRAATPTVLFSGAVTERHKGVPTLLLAADRLAARVPDLRVWLSGPGDPAPLLAEAPASARARVDALPLGEPGDQASRYGRAWATALPSKGDSFGMALLESLACGTPIVASTHAAPCELVEPDVTGALCPPDDPDALAEALQRVLALAERTATVDACRAAAAPFDWATGIAPRFEALYRD